VILTHLCSKLWCWCKSVLTVYCPRLPLRTLRSCCLCFRSSASRVSLDGLTAGFHFPESEQWSASGASLSRDRHCKTVLQSSCCSTETGDDTAYFQATTEGLAAPHLMCRQTEGTWFPAVRRCCSVFCDSGAGYKTADLLTYIQWVAFCKLYAMDSRLLLTIFFHTHKWRLVIANHRQSLFTYRA